MSAFAVEESYFHHGFLNPDVFDQLAFASGWTWICPEYGDQGVLVLGYDVFVSSEAEAKRSRLAAAVMDEGPAFDGELSFSLHLMLIFDLEALLKTSTSMLCRYHMFILDGFLNRLFMTFVFLDLRAQD